MKITETICHLISYDWSDDPWMPQFVHAQALIQVKTDTELDGWGEVTAGYFAPEAIPPLVQHFQPVLTGKDPQNVTRLARAMYDDAVWWARNGLGRSVISGMELALWDLKGKALGIPVYQLLGGKCRDRIPVYASGGPALWPLEQNVRKAKHYAELGFTGIKIATRFHELAEPTGSDGTALPNRLDIVDFPHAEKVQKVGACFDLLRSQMGPDYDLAVDGHEGGVSNPIPLTEAVEIADVVAPYRLQFYEEPLAYTNLDSYTSLCRSSRVPIAGGESLCGVSEFHQIIANEAVHMVQPDLGYAGGLYESLRIIHHAEGFNLNAALHQGEAIGPLFGASWHLAAACPSIRWLECLPANLSINRKFLADPLEIKDGYANVPEAPGLGVNITPELLEQYPFVPDSGERT